jgi:hypothetical protein
MTLNVRDPPVYGDISHHIIMSQAKYAHIDNAMSCCGDHKVENEVANIRTYGDRSVIISTFNGRHCDQNAKDDNLTNSMQGRAKSLS